MLSLRRPISDIQLHVLYFHRSSIRCVLPHPLLLLSRGGRSNSAPFSPSSAIASQLADTTAFQTRKPLGIAKSCDQGKGSNDSPRTLQPSPRAIHDSHWTSGKCGPRTDQSFLADVRWRTTPSPRSLSGLIATQSDLKRATTLNPPITP